MPIPLAVNGSASPVQRSDEQKALRKLIIQKGLKMGRQSGLLLVLAIGCAVGGILGKGALLGLGLVGAAACLALGVPLAISGRRLSATSSTLLAAIDDPTRVAALHVEDRTRAKDRHVFGLRYADGGADTVLLSADEVQQLHGYLSARHPAIEVVASANAAHSVRVPAAA